MSHPIMAGTPFYTPYIIRGRQNWREGRGEAHEPGVFRLVAVLDGMYQFRTSEGPMSASPGEVCLIAPSTVFDGAMSDGGHAILIVFVTDSRGLIPSDDIGRYSLIHRDWQHASATEVWGIDFPVILNQELSKALLPGMRWMANLWWRDDWHHYLANQCLTRFLEQIARSYRKAAGLEAEFDDMAMAIQGLIDNHIEVFHSTVALAEHFGVQVDALRAIYARSHGETPANYIKHRRLALAQEMLSDPSISLEKVGARLGFTSLSAFSQYCRRHLGVAPSQWRRAYLAR